jgi:alpha-ribazole phosphatase/probable phosphoglycerate mutase
MRRVFFIRHAETEMAGRYCGHSDPDLNAQGRAQLTRLSRLLAEEMLDTVYSSDLRRAASTAEAIVAARNIPQGLRPALREINFGDWEGLSWEEIERLDPEYAQKWVKSYPQLSAPSGESFEDFERRVITEVNHLMDRSRGPIAVVTHGGVLRVVLRHLCGYSEPRAWQETQQYCCVVRYEGQGESK